MVNPRLIFFFVGFFSLFSYAREGGEEDEEEEEGEEVREEMKDDVISG